MSRKLGSRHEFRLTAEQLEAYRFIAEREGMGLDAWIRAQCDSRVTEWKSCPVRTRICRRLTRGAGR